jgi:hypothetical protein
MLEDDEDGYDAQCSTFNALVYSDSSAEVYIAECLFTDDLQACSNNKILNPVVLSSKGHTYEPLEENAWQALPVNIANLENGCEQPTDGIYEPQPIWERPIDHAVSRVDAFKVLCHVNSLKEPAIVAVGDSGAAPMLISLTKLPRPPSRSHEPGRNSN